MFRLWAREFQNTKLLRDTVIEDASDNTRTHKVFNAIDKICSDFDLGKPIWLDKNITEFKRFAKTRFYADNFVESIDFDFLEVHVIDED